MADNTHIEWADATVNAVNGCSVLSPGCTNCYAMKLAGTRLKHVPSRAGLTQDSKAGPVWTGEVRLDEKQLLQPLRWKRPRRIFWNAHGDLFHPNVPWEWTAKVMASAFLSPHHIHTILTKRADRMNAWFDTLATEGGAEDFSEIIELMAESVGRECDYPEWTLPLENVWLGVSVEDQARADERIPDLLDTPAAVRFLSCEPLLGQIDLTGLDGPGDPASHNVLAGRSIVTDCNGDEHLIETPTIDWVIVGGESGPGARPMHPEWARSLRDQCQSAGVSFFFKQWGEWGPDTGPLDDCYPNSTIRRDPIMEGDARCAVLVDGAWQHFESGYGAPIELCSGPGDFVYRIGKKRAGRLLDGREWNEVPT